MRALNDIAVLALWERGRDRIPVERALLLLSAALPKRDESDCAALTVGERDVAVTQLRCATFGTTLPACVLCPVCGESLEFELDAGLLASGAPRASEFAIGDALRFRLPNSGDLIAAAHCGTPDAAARKLLQSCCLDAVAAAEWPPALLAEAEATMARLAEPAEVLLDLGCAA